MSANKHVVLPPHVANNPQRTKPNNQNTGVDDFGTINIYFNKKSPLLNFDYAALKVHVRTASGQVQPFIGMVTLNLPHFLDDFPRTGHVVSLLKHTLIVIGSICDAECTVVFTKQIVLV